MNLRDIHTPVLLERCIELLAPALSHDGAVLVDATLGMGGHSEAFLERFPGIHLIGLDRDRDALRIAGERLAPFGDRVTLVHTVYDGIVEAVDSAGFEKADAVLFDLGVSSLQLDVADRGFAYSQDAPLDMRMDQTTGPTAADVLATYSEGQLRAIFERYGEEKLSARYARSIIAARREAPIERSGRLVEILVAATPAAAQRAGHPAKRVFQALRIEVNAELAAVERAIPAALEVLPVGGRIVVLSYQSLEDRIVKRALSAATASTAPSGLPIELPEHAPRFRLLVKGAELAGEEERARNPRATPVRLRAAERVRDAA
ncbi:16S rRNA (cytosine(1402)-N(4))-methyltransferase RsmH [Microbacterium sp. DT81.1]|uniref:16S rRNA (cytosine(1402)-N(4))-methyltransferase RsmH n=1 Tax=Microbacterium sp. DT81.1 TaxID=3393413 RepID=UPI003CF7B8E4